MIGLGWFVALDSELVCLGLGCHWLGCVEVMLVMTWGVRSLSMNDNVCLKAKLM